MLEVSGLDIAFDQGPVVRDFQLAIGEGERVGIVGESGCGKSITALSIMGMVPATATVSGSIRFDGHELHGQPESVWRQIRARRIAMIFQEPLSALNPLKTIFSIIAEPLLTHEGCSRSEARERVLGLLDEVRMPEPGAKLGQYPHQLSGGQRQRVMIAAALACRPQLLIADEPTTALDASLTNSIIDLLVGLSRRRDMALIFISHDLRAVARATQSLLVMCDGEVVERGQTSPVIAAPRHPYTQGLIAARPRLDLKRPVRTRLPTMAAFTPMLGGIPAVAPGDTAYLDASSKQPEIRNRQMKPASDWTVIRKHQGSHRQAGTGATTLLQLENVSRIYPLPRRSLFSRRPLLKAASNATLRIERGQTVGIVGESGSGKSTLARLAMGFERPDRGRVLFQGEDINAIRGRALLAIRPRFQMVFQDPFGSLDPRKSVGWSIAEPLLQDHGVDAAERQERVFEVLEQVGLKAEDHRRYPHMFSGGQRQRVAIARAVITNPDLIVADEPVSALDVSMQAQVLNLLMDMQEALGVGILLISHDLAVVASMCDEIHVMSHGEIVEAGPTREVLSQPAHAVTRELLTSSGHTVAAA